MSDAKKQKRVVERDQAEAATVHNTLVEECAEWLSILDQIGRLIECRKQEIYGIIEDIREARQKGRDVDSETKSKVPQAKARFKELLQKRSGVQIEDEAQS